MAMTRCVLPVPVPPTSTTLRRCVRKLPLGAHEHHPPVAQADMRDLHRHRRTRHHHHLVALVALVRLPGARLSGTKAAADTAARDRCQPRA